MVMDLGLEGEQSEDETPEATPLEEQGAPESQEEHASALEAATAGDLKALEAALVRGESTEQTDTLGRTPLLIAVQVNNPISFLTSLMCLWALPSAGRPGNRLQSAAGLHHRIKARATIAILNWHLNAVLGGRRMGTRKWQRSC
jgi:hypothetical protein